MTLIFMHKKILKIIFTSVRSKLLKIREKKSNDYYILTEGVSIKVGEQKTVRWGLM